MVPASVQKAQNVKAALRPFTNQPSSSNSHPPPAQNAPPAKKPKTDAPPSHDEHLEKASKAFDALSQHTYMDSGPLYHPNPRVSPAQQQQAKDIQKANAAVQSGVQIAKDRKEELERAKANKASAKGLKIFQKTGDMFARKRRALHRREVLRTLKRSSRNRLWSDI